MPGPPPIDMHCHVDVGIAGDELQRLKAVLFAATRSLTEAAEAQRRNDNRTVWGVGAHPGLARAHRDFDRTRFSELIGRTPLVSEVGLDGSSRVPIDAQRDTFGAVLATLQNSPRITSIHSFRATDAVIESLTARPIDGAVLHWWLGTEAQTRQAIELGCYFSINAAMLKSPRLASLVPLSRLLPETDHPHGDRSSGRHRRPGHVDNVEHAIARAHGLDQAAVRFAMWRNLATLARVTQVERLLPRRVRVELLALGSE